MTRTTEPDAEPTKETNAQSASAKVVREILRGLHEGLYAPGQRLIEPELMEQFGISRSTARESIRRMEAEGIVDVLPHRGAIIRRMTREEALNALLVMELCIGLAARQAAQHINEADNHARFQTAWDELQAFQATPDGFDMVKARDRFYSAMTRISGNRELQRIVPAIHIHLIRRDYSLPAHIRFQDYQQIARAILAGNPAEAEEAARNHISKTAALVRQAEETR